MGVVDNFIRFPPVQKFRKLVKIWHSYRELKGGTFLRKSISVEFVIEGVMQWKRASDSDLQDTGTVQYRTYTYWRMQFKV